MPLAGDGNFSCRWIQRTVWFGDIPSRATGVFPGVHACFVTGVGCVPTGHTISDRMVSRLLKLKMPERCSSEGPEQGAIKGRGEPCRLHLCLAKVTRQHQHAGLIREISHMEIGRNGRSNQLRLFCRSVGLPVHGRISAMR